MKKYTLLVGLLLGTVASRAQGQLGIKVSPSVSFNKMYTSPPDIGFYPGRKALCFKLGATYEFPIQNNYCVDTGLFYATQCVSIKREVSSIKEEHLLCYLQVPLLLKLYTNELTLDTRLYVALGTLCQLRINEENTELQKSQKNPFIETFRLWGFAGLLEIGVAYDVGLSTSIFGGISCQYGLSNAVDRHTPTPSNNTVKSYGNLLSIDLGIRF